MLLVYYNPNQCHFYSVLINTFCDYKIGYINGFNHVLVQIFVIEDNVLIPTTSYMSYIYDYIKKKNSLKKNTFKNTVINHLIDLLYKLKK